MAKNLEESMKGSGFVFNWDHLLYYKYQKINFKRGGWYIDSPDGIENKKATINAINKKDNKCFNSRIPSWSNRKKFWKTNKR